MRTDIAFEWDYVDARTRRRVRRGMMFFMLALFSVVAVYLVASRSEPTRYYYQSFARRAKADPNDSNSNSEQEYDEALTEIDKATEHDTQSNSTTDRASESNASIELELPTPDDAPADTHQPQTESTASETIREVTPGRQANVSREEQEQHSAAPETVADSGSRRGERDTQDNRTTRRDYQPRHGGLAQRDSEPANASVGATRIEAGENAPYFSLTSLEEYRRMARDHNGQFIAWDGSTAVRIGSTLDPPSDRFDLLGDSWHQRYASRMATLPDAPEVRAVLDRVRTVHPGLRPNVQVQLSLPYAYDHAILRAQQEWFAKRGSMLDVKTVTQGYFVGGSDSSPPSFRIERVFRVDTSAPF